MATTAKKPSSDPSPTRGGNPAKLVPGLKAGQERGPDGKIKAKEPALSTESADMLDAMRHVVCQPASADTTFQQRNVRKWMDDAPGAFHARLMALEDAGRPSKPVTAPAPVKWDGLGPCPTCKHEVEKPIEDAGASKILALLDELDEQAADGLVG